MLDAKRMISTDALLKAAATLKSDDGSNPEYDRALIELIIEVTPGADVNNDWDTIADAIACRVP